MIHYLNEIKRWLRTTRVPPRDIADATGTTYSWVVMLRRGLIINPGYEQVHRVYWWAKVKGWP